MGTRDTAEITGICERERPRIIFDKETKEGNGTHSVYVVNILSAAIFVGHNQSSDFVNFYLYWSIVKLFFFYYYYNFFNSQIGQATWRLIYHSYFRICVSLYIFYDSSHTLSYFGLNWSTWSTFSNFFLRFPFDYRSYSQIVSQYMSTIVFFL